MKNYHICANFYNGLPSIDASNLSIIILMQNEPVHHAFIYKNSRSFLNYSSEQNEKLKKELKCFDIVFLQEFQELNKLFSWNVVKERGSRAMTTSKMKVYA